ncbi:MAG: hypothetical protein Tsb0020_53330 [Haliangiales bacterium]
MRATSHYELAPEILRAASSARGAAPGADGQESEANSQGFDADRQGFDADRQGFDAETSADRQGFDAETSADRQGFDADRQGFEDRSPELLPDVAAILEVLGRRPRKPKLRAAILSLAALRPWRPLELAELLGFADVSKLVHRHLSPMVPKGLLERTHPENLAHPAQAYRAAEKGST